MVQTDRCPPVSNYKEEPVDDPLRHGSSVPLGSQNQQQLQTPRPDLASLQKQDSVSPVSTTVCLPPATYPPPPSLGNGILHSHSSYGSPSQETHYYTSHSPLYSTVTAPAQYSSSGPSDLMATTAQMQRPSYPPIYHTPQSNSPASVASQPHDQHGRSLYTQSPQIPPQMYGYPPYSPINPIQPPYASHPSPQPHASLTTQSMMMPPQTSTAQMSPHQPSHTPNTALSSSPGMKMDPAPHSSAQRSMLNPTLPVPTNAGIPTGPVQTSPLGASSSAAPGPIPATTPLVVRQDNNGVQWIAFEYSRDRVKMEYTIRCDVESVNVDSLSQDFKTENCVYPRACCSKDQYRGNRLVYETECNAVGWALADLNPALRGKRGLIQRAVDSWRNSNQDPRLRSRRVRRQHKMSRRQSVQPPTPQMPPAGSISHGLGAASGHRGSIGGSLMGPPMTHHHAQPDGSPKVEQVSGTADYNLGARPIDTGRLPPAPLGATDIRPAQVFHDAHVIPGPTSISPSMPPLLREGGLGSLGRHPTIATSSSRMASTTAPTELDDEVSPTNDDLFGQLPDGKRRTFILVEDPQRGSRVRVKVGLDKVKMDEIPDSYRKINAVYPRTYFPTQMKDAPLLVDPMDAYRNKMRTSMIAAGQEASEIPEHFDTRRGKRRFLERTRRMESDALSATQRGAEEVEG
ncbi:uncharacterized protein N7483_000707 [Penicillium malachiteum]|uniref:uncharacterized protein n=1 Tax=Penicillium malachiteum TaxID=1324776 RepID=UPI002546BD8D|nr:uncharacterized protein N7483_000707 [Penicillium malachiteum]KAJ5735582.1 hypothetical protein N7483_000707 [Penicillium malachiteum]